MGQFLVLDLDETLIANSLRDARPSPKIQILTRQAEYGFTDRFVVRPYAEDFLSWCKEHFAHVILATFSPESRAEDILGISGLRQYFDLVVSHHILDTSKGLLLLGGDPDSSYDFGGDFCLIDDQDWDSDHVLIKMNFFGVDVRPVVKARLDGEPLSGYPEVEDHLFSATPYEGDPDDNFFLRLLEAFEANYFPDEKLTA